ncbi:MAG: flavodoxin [Chloroflexota bacterium]
MSDTKSSNFRLDESDPRFLIVHEEGHPDRDDYQQFMQHWVSRLDAYEQSDDVACFGVLIVHGRHEHDHDDEDHEHERDGDAEAAFTRMINDFRRDHRDRVSVACTGYANVYDAEDIKKWYGEGEEGLTKMSENMQRFSQYMFGVPAGVFTEVDAAKAWLIKQGSVPQSPDAEEPAANQPASITESSVGLFYGSTTGVTEHVAQCIETAWADAGQEPLITLNITDVDDISVLADFDKLILGIPTWNIGQLQDDWEIVFPDLDDLDFTGTQVALFGIGDAHGYPENFLDAMGMLGDKVRGRGAQLVGYWPTDGYEFDASTALDNGMFMGLGIDEVRQADLTEERVTQWVAQVIGEFALVAT